MKLRRLITLTLALSVIHSSHAFADVAPGQSMTHMKTTPGLASTLESIGVIFYVQGGATSGLIGESVSATNSQVVFHIPITGSKNGVKHNGSNIVFFNTLNNSQVQLKNPVIDLAKGIVTATIPQASNQSITVLNISNSSELKSKTSTDSRTRIKSKVYSGAALNLAPGVAGTLNSLLGLAPNSISEGAVFGSTDVTLKRTVKSR